MPDPTTPTEPAIPSENPPSPGRPPDIDPASSPEESPIYDPNPNDPGDWRPRD